eukprot:CAMPEP_0179301332 /NCGR_PEP_ID=MMETSP0797-20121207/47500_1 /TAXON_ID=47934 /ORGANISM="Dinophysis acuminata, Strain DAEP01" /LENGTH=95 /DNA_ID=CAMNT_0021010839 /DNA_START=45 /DNA_END=329 /DNA_ORIENTATION=+
MAETNQPVQATVVQGTVVQPAPAAQTMGNSQPAYGVGATKQVQETQTEYPYQTTCQWCGQSVTTTTSHKPSNGTHAVCLGLCCIGCDCGCCLIPY